MARTMSMLTMVFALAPLLAPTLGAAIISVAAWQWMFVALAAFGLVCLLMVAFLPETHPAQSRTDTGVRGAIHGYSSILHARAFIIPAAIASLGSMTLFAYIASSPAVLMGAYGLTPQQFALAFGGVSLAMVVGSQINVRLLRRHPVHLLLRSYLALQVGSTLALVVLSAAGAPVQLIIAGLACAVACFAGTAANAVTEALRPFPHLAGSASAALGVLQFGLGALVAAGLSRTTGSAALLMSAPMAVASIAALGLSALRRSAPVEDDPRRRGA